MSLFKKVVVGISGGVDSAVSAHLLKKLGYEVCGLFMDNWDIADEHGTCTSEREYEDAISICRTLDVPLRHVSFVKQYWNEVFLELVADYQNGYTPNPDVQCNKHIKFNHFSKYAKDVLKADAIATGHYAQTSFGCYLENYDSKKVVRLLQARDEVKDQTFFLCQIKQNVLRHTMFPLGDMTKSQVKEIASKNGLQRISRKKESMGICFIGSKNFQHFISKYVVEKPGSFVDIDTGKVMGEHNGFHQWTVGQRARIPGQSEAYYIAKKDVTTNVIYVAMGTKHPAFHTTLFFTSSPHWIGSKPFADGVFDCQFKFQHTHDLCGCKLCETNEGAVVLLHEEKRAVTPGQYAVFYKDGECLGSARITHPGVSSFSLQWLDRFKRCRRKN